MLSTNFMSTCVVVCFLALASVCCAQVDENVDHAGLIRAWNQKTYQAGEQIYTTVCFACHGLDGKQAANPQARAFAKDTLRNGNDPYSMFKTLTAGFNGMPPQTWLTPEQRYQVIDYIREKFLKTDNAGQYFKINDPYLASLPKFNAALAHQKKKRVRREYGPVLASQLGHEVHSGLTFQLGRDVSMTYDLHRMNVGALWRGGFLNLSKTEHYLQRGEGMPSMQGKPVDGLQTWQWEYGGSFDHDEQQQPERSPAPTQWMRYLGHYTHGYSAVLSYQIMGRGVLETPGVTVNGDWLAVYQTLRVDAGKQPLRLCVGQFKSGQYEVNSDKPSVVVRDGQRVFAAALVGDTQGLTWQHDDAGRVMLTIPASDSPRVFRVVRTAGKAGDTLDPFDKYVAFVKPGDVVDPLTMTHGGPRLWSKELTVTGQLGTSDDAYVVDTIPVPFENPWNAWMRTSALDFFKDGRCAVATYGGDVWIVSGIDSKLNQVTWTRYASGMFEPLGIKIVDDVIYVTCRDGIKRLHDLNHDGQADFYENFFTDPDVSCMFHSFNFDLQHDSKGNFYYGKVGQYTHYSEPGAIIKVAPDGQSYHIVCKGLRVPNGLGMLPGDRLTFSDNQGPWMPASKINLVREGAFFGNPPHENLGQKPGKIGYDPKTFDWPMVWMEQDLDSSSGGQVWVDDARFGPLAGHLLHTSFGKGKFYYLMMQNVGDVTQAAIVRIEKQFDAGIMRARVNPADGQVYATGLSGWQGPPEGKDGCLQRLRYTGKPYPMLEDVQVTPHGLKLAFNFDLADDAAQADCFHLEQWNYLWTSKYGSAQYRPSAPDQKGHDPVTISQVVMGKDRRSLELVIPQIKPVWEMKIMMDLPTVGGARFQQRADLTIRKIPQ